MPEELRGFASDLIQDVTVAKPGEMLDAFGKARPIPPRRRLPVIKVMGSGTLPTRAHAGDAGFDLYCAEGATLKPGELGKIPCGLDMQPPDGHWLLLVGRSSTLGRGLLVHTTVIDGGYRGPMFVTVLNVGHRPAEIEAGERLAQIVPVGLVSSAITVERVDSLDPSERGSDGFGSTGR